ncbi:hypothetical protein NQ318_017572 [Aromia moschata]|uniref:Uridine diphosphate glucose pyrophosphatase NUDT14 n=1 Tax=Aromia moschata TaxID=1265417 RepID=A0AAV8Z2L0_9CUCU|nr:hypothetical protein NQ318_017572 [Aromia moschata]
MDKVSDVTVKPLDKSIYMKPFTMHYIQNGTKKTWDLLSVHDSVAIIIYNITRDVLIFVKQFRPAVYFGTIPEEERKVDNKIDTEKYPPELGITIELCAGIVDKDLPLDVIAKEEVLEECDPELVHSEVCRLRFYCEVTDDMKVSEGGGIGDEIIDVIEMSVDEVKKYVSQDNVKSPPSFMFSIYWFLYHKVMQRIH